MTIKDYKDGKMVTLSVAFDTRPKVLNVFYFFVYVVTGYFFLSQLFNNYLSIGWSVFAIALSVLFLIPAYRFVNKAVMSESVFINKQEFRIVKKGLRKMYDGTFELSMIKDFRYLTKPEMEKHPLAGESFDYLGFQTQQLLINEMYGDNKLAFDYDGRTIRFGENVYSWEFEELEALIQAMRTN
ncbi:MAG TPA: hypothetical protein VNU72_13780 [Puia sp.]|jgi:hypothetical protein|nr:hypothetical protein [Puia sp.]